MQRHATRLLVSGVMVTTSLTINLSACQQRNADAVGATARELTSITTIGTLNAPGLVEASGVARSTRTDNAFWSQNDSGNDAELFAYDSTGASLGVAHVTGARNRDWEAIAIGPCTEGSCVYIGDVGDNGARRDKVTIWRAIEPTVGDSVTAPVTELRFSYPDGPRDVEAMWVSPDTTVWLLTKRPIFRPDGTSRPAQLYRLPASMWTDSAEHVAILVDSLPIVPLASSQLTWITDASLSLPDSAGVRHLAVRTYEQVFVFSADSLTGRPGALEHRCSLAPLRQRTGEGVVWLADGRLLFIAEGRGSALQAGRCR